MTTYFITGAHGFIGSWITKALLERGDTPVVFDLDNDQRRLGAIIDSHMMARVRFVAGDVTDSRSVHNAIAESGARRVIHLAGLQVPTCKAEPAKGALVNVIGTLNVFEAAARQGLERVVYASSAAVFGATDNGTPLDESAPCEPATHYGVFKRTNEGNARVYFQDTGLSTVGLRPLTVYGVGRDIGITSDPTRAMKAAVLGRRFRIRFTGRTDFQYAADTAAAFVESADRAPEGAHVFNLHGDVVEIGQIVSIIDRELLPESRGLITFGGPALPLAPAMDDSAIRKVLGNLPVTPLEVGIRETIRRFAELRDSGRLDTSDIDEAA